MEDYQANRLQAGQGRMHGEGGQARGRTSILILDILTANEMCTKPGTCDFIQGGCTTNLCKDNNRS